MHACKFARMHCQSGTKIGHMGPVRVFVFRMVKAKRMESWFIL
jgi:hypothetical protein